MRFHRHQVGRRSRWHSVRVHHEDAWEWCAHHEEIERYLARRRRNQEAVRASKQLKVQPAH